jgi:acetate kinase
VDVVELLSEHDLFTGFTPEDLRDICNASEIRTFEPKETIIRAGEPGRFLGVILEGRAEALRVNEEGEEERVGELTAYDYFGEISLISGEPTTANVRAVTRCRALLIPHEVMSASLSTHPRALHHLGRTVAERLRSIWATQAAEERPEPTPAAGEAPAAAVSASAAAARVLVIDSAPTMVRYSYFDVERGLHNREGVVEHLAQARARHTVRKLRGKAVAPVSGGRRAAIEAVLGGLTEPDGPLERVEDLSVIAHRVLHGGERFGEPMLVDDMVVEGVRQELRVGGEEARANLEGIEVCRSLAPGVRQVAVFETAFFQAVPAHAYVYALPYELYRDEGLRRYGSNGVAHRQAALLAATHLQRPLEELRVVSCYLGSEPSVCAVADGRAVEVTGGVMGRGGLPGMNGPGDLDPDIALRLCRAEDTSPEDMERLLRERGGLRALSGVAGGMGELTTAAEGGDARASLAVDVMAHAIKKAIGASVAILGGVDVLVLTGPQSEAGRLVRDRALGGLEGLGLHLDRKLNAAPESDADGVSELSPSLAAAKILLVPSDGHRMIASEVLGAIGREDLAALFRSRRLPIPIGISAHHVHLTQEHVEALFGPGHQLTFRAELSQAGQFACDEQVTLVGPRGSVERVRVLGPVRNATQVEISRTEEFRLGIDAPIRASGNTKGSPGLQLEGPAGSIDLQEGVICAARHVHMSPEDALRFGVRDRALISVRVEGGRGVSFRDVLVRVHPDFRLDMHVDTDEANAAELGADAVGYVESIENPG